MATKEKTEQEVIREAMGLLGKRSTPKKRSAALTNGAATRWQPQPLDALACTCGKCPDSPKTYCPRGRAIIRRRAKAQATAQGSGDMATANEYSTVESKETRESRETKRREAVRAGFGKFAGFGETPEERRRAKDAELQREAAL